MRFIQTILAFATMCGALTVHAEETCFNARRVRELNVINDQLVSVETRNQRLLVQVGYCSELRWAQTFAFSSHGATDRICWGDDLLILEDFYPHRVIERCLIRSVQVDQAYPPSGQ